MARTTTFHGTRLLAFAVCIGASVAAWELPFLTPVKLLAVMGHETGHALASLLVGGEVTEVSISGNQSGHCLSQTPNGFLAKVLVFSGGYVGAAIAAALLLLLTFRLNAGRVMLALACAWLALMGLFYGRDAFTLFFCLGMSVLFALGARLLPAAAVSAVNLFLATFTALYAVFDLKDDLWDSTVRSQSDAQLLANITPVPAIIWAALWTATSLAIVAMGAWLAMRGRASGAAGFGAPRTRAAL